MNVSPEHRASRPTNPLLSASGPHSIAWRDGDSVMKWALCQIISLDWRLTCKCSERDEARLGRRAVAHSCNVAPVLWEAETGGSQVQALPGKFSDLVNPCFKIKEKT